MTMSFSGALNALKTGLKVARTGWNGKGLWLELQRPDAHSKMTLPYIFMSYPADAQNTPGARVPWLASQTDLLSDDWILVGHTVDGFMTSEEEAIPAQEYTASTHDNSFAVARESKL